MPDPLLDKIIRFIAEREGQHKRRIVSEDVLTSAHFAALARECAQINRFLVGLRDEKIPA